MKQILISIKPKWVAKILRGEKTLEIRKTAPLCELPCEVYIYCTKNGEQISRGTLRGVLKPLNGKVVAKFRLELVHEIAYCSEAGRYLPFNYFGYNVEKRSCLSPKELDSYLNNRRGYAWHISDLEIFDNPKKLSDFCTYKKPSYILERAPQSWCYVEAEK